MTIRKLHFFAAAALCVAAVSASIAPAFANEATAQQVAQDDCARTSCDDLGASHLKASEDTDTQKQKDDAMDFAVGLIMIICVLYFIPTIIAAIRGHNYTWVIFALNLFGGWTGLGWLAAMIWSVWPKEKALIDPFFGNVTGTGRRNAGNVLGEVDVHREQTLNQARAVIRTAQLDRPASQLDQLAKLGDLRNNGIITEDEFIAAKASILNS